MRSEAGQLRHRGTVERNQGVQNTTGEVVPDWVAVYASVPAAVEPLRGREFYAARQFNAEVTHRIILRKESRVVRARDRFVVNGRIFDIDSVRDLEERGAWLELICTEKA